MLYAKQIGVSALSVSTGLTMTVVVLSAIINLSMIGAVNSQLASLWTFFFCLKRESILMKGKNSHNETKGAACKGGFISYLVLNYFVRTREQVRGRKWY
jgi:hypothetical protein